MEIDTKSKRSKRRNLKDAEAVNKVTDKYMNINHSNLTEEDMEKINNYYLFRIELADKMKDSDDLEELAELTEESVKKNLNLELDFVPIESRHALLDSECRKLKDLNNELNKKLNDKDKYSKMLIEKINVINSEKNKTIQDESEKRNNLVKETEAFVRSLQPKYEDELKEKMKLIEENQTLRAEIEKCIQSSTGLKSILENQLREKEKVSLTMENRVKNILKDKMDAMSLEAQNYIINNSELKIQNANYKKKNEEMLSMVNSFKQEHDKLRNDLDKKKQDIILLSAENYELQSTIKASKITKQTLEQIHKENDKMTNQIAAMKKLNKKLLDQLDELSKPATATDADTDNKVDY